ncbi:hypothetical protein, partial [Lacticaseibacillus nasuensis]|uniref:hypothetical protein n=1 Tax=Lacticaseibacillus nasuensis TaxID=944671 RepID=UPI0022487340
GTNKTTMNNKAAFANIISAVAAVSYHDYEGKAERRPQMVFCPLIVFLNENDCNLLDEVLSSTCLSLFV